MDTGEETGVMKGRELLRTLLTGLGDWIELSFGIAFRAFTDTWRSEVNLGSSRLYDALFGPGFVEYIGSSARYHTAQCESSSSHSFSLTL